MHRLPFTPSKYKFVSCLLAKQPLYQKRTDQELPASPGGYKRQQRARRKPGRTVGSERLNGKRRQTKQRRAQPREASPVQKERYGGDENPLGPARR